jgi:hypothetical protein
VLASRIVGLEDVCGDGAAFDDGSTVCRDEDGRLSKLVNVEKFRWRTVTLISFVEDQIVFDIDLFEEPDNAL